MTVAIITKYHPATNCKGARISVQRADHRKGDRKITEDYYSLRKDDGSFNSDSVHQEAFKLWARGLPEESLLNRGTWALGHTLTGAVFVQITNVGPLKVHNYDD